MEKLLLFIQCGGGETVRTNSLLTAKKLGYKIAIAEKTFNNELGLADYVLNVNTNNIDELLVTVHDFNSIHKISGVLTVTEFAVEQTAIIASILGLPSLDIRAAKICRNKYLTRQIIKEANLKQPNFVMVKDIEALALASKELNFPIVIKPLNFAGSCAVRRVNTLEELDYAIKIVKSDRCIAPMNKWATDTIPEFWLAEEYMDGIEVSVEVVVYNGQVEVIAIHDKMLPMEGPIFLEEFFVTPSPRISDEIDKEIRLATKNILEAIGYNLGLAHVEFRITKDGVKLLEINPRVGGILVSLSTQYSTGVNLFECLIDMAVGNKPNLNKIDHIPTAFGTVYSPVGTIKEVSGIEEARKVDGVKEIKQWLNVGDTVSSTEVAYGAAVLVTDKSSEQAFNKVQAITNSIKFEV